MTRSLLAACLLLALPTTALADVVPSPPTDCRDGSHGRTGHAGPWCNPTTCTTDADCREEGTTCREAALCVQTQEYSVGGWAGDQRSTRDIAHGPCGANGQCAEGECRRAKYCMRAGAGSGDEGGQMDEGGDTEQGDEVDEGGDTDEGGDRQEPGDDSAGEGSPTGMDTSGGQPPAGQRPGEDEGAEEEDEDDGGCSASGAGAVPTWALVVIGVALVTRRRRAH